MSLFLDEKCLDLGDAGFLAISCEVAGVSPALAQEVQYARWHKPDGCTEDVSHLFLRPLNVPEARRALEIRYRQCIGHRAVASVVGACEWALGRMSDGACVLPSFVVALEGVRVVALYASLGDLPALRVIDVANGVIASEVETECLRRRWLQSTREMDPLDARLGEGRCRLGVSGAEHLAIFLGNDAFLTRVEGRDFEMVRPMPLGSACFAGSWLVTRERDGSFLLRNHSDEAEAESLEPSYSGWIGIAGSRNAARMALAYAGGTCEIVDLPAAPCQALRPMPHVDKNAQLHPAMSVAGRSLAVRHGNVLRWVDLQRARVVEIPLPHRDDFDREVFSPAVVFNPDFLIRDDELITLSRGATRVFRRSEMDWEPVVHVTTQRTTSSDPFEAFDLAAQRATIERWRKSTVALHPGSRKKTKTATSFLYGHVDLPASFWPEHDGVQMQLLCQIDLRAVLEISSRTGLPTEGRLLCFCSVDENGELAEGEDLGTPAAVCVLYIDDEAQPSLPADALEAVPLTVKADVHDLPEPDAPIVQLEHWDDLELERYRAFLEAHRGDAKDGGHRIGGYPTLLQSNDLEYEAAQAADADDDSSFRREAAAAARWRLLLQLESDEFMWGADSGILYLMIREDDLAATDFSRVVALTQGY